MVQVLTPRMSRGFSWGWCLVAALATFPPSVFGQGGVGKGDAKKAATPANAKKANAKDEVEEDVVAKPEGSGVVDAPQMKRLETNEIFKDPRAEKAIANTFAEIPAPQGALTATDISSLKNMASGLQAPDPGLITRAVDIQAAAMTSRKNIKYVIGPPPGVGPKSETLRAIEKASQTLVDLLVTAREKKNDAFLAVYRPILFAKLQPLLSNHLFARMQASIILATAATPNTIDVFNKQLSDPKQVVWVKLWSARGISIATQDGRITPDVVKATAAAAALVGFLDQEPDAPWPVKVRALEALGNLRLASTLGPQGKPDVIAAVARFLCDDKEKLEVRAWAAWSLGMIPVPSSQASFNFPLVAYKIGRLALEIGEKIGEEYDLLEKDFTKRSDYARFLTGLLLYQVDPALSGESEIQGAGLLKMRHNALGPVQPFLKGLDEELKGLSRESIALLRAGGNETKGVRKEIAARVASLSSYLDKNRPADAPLYPGGPKFPLAPAAQVAGGPAPAK